MSGLAKNRALYWNTTVLGGVLIIGIVLADAPGTNSERASPRYAGIEAFTKERTARSGQVFWSEELGRSSADKCRLRPAREPRGPTPALGVNYTPRRNNARNRLSALYELSARCRFLYGVMLVRSLVRLNKAYKP